MEDKEQQTGCKLGKEYVKVYCHLAYSSYMQNTSCEIPDWMKHKLESRLLGEILKKLRHADESESDSHSVVSDSLGPHGLSMVFSSPEYWSE